MAQSTPRRELANLDPVTFHFVQAFAVDVIVNFYDVAGTLLAPAGSIDLTAAYPLASYAGATNDPTVLPEIEAQPFVPTITAAANVVQTLNMGGNGGGRIKLTPSAVVPPGGAVYYTIKLAAAQTRAPEPLT